MRAILGRRRAKVAVAVVGLLVATACGSTARDEAGGEQHRARSGAADEFSADVADPTDDGDPTGAADTTDVRPGAVGTAPTPPGPLGGASGTSGNDPAAAADGAAGVVGGKVPVGPDVRGVTGDTIYVGMVDLGGEQQGQRLGGNYSGEAPPRREVGEALAADLNEHGGVAGRKLEIVWHSGESSTLVTAEGRRQDAQQACATWTEDNSVFAILNNVAVSEVYYGCAQRNNAVIVPWLTAPAVDEQLLAQLDPLWYSMDRMIADRRDRNLVENLVGRGVLTPDAKVGIMVEDSAPVKRGVANGMEPALAAHGIEVVAKAIYPDIIASPWDTYVLQFRQAGVTHVLAAQTWDGVGWPTVYFMKAAEQQGWRPTWGLGSDNSPWALATNGVPRPQLANAFAMGWRPAPDVGREDETEARTRCEEIAHETAQPINDDTRNVWLSSCDMLFFLQAALDRAPEVSPAGMRAAMEALGDSYESIATIGGQTQFGADRPDGPAVQRDLVYDRRCTDDGTNCWRYTGDPRPLP